MANRSISTVNKSISTVDRSIYIANRQYIANTSIISKYVRMFILPYWLACTWFLVLYLVTIGMCNQLSMEQVFKHICLHEIAHKISI